MGLLTLFVALCISGIAAYYSIIGLTAIFAAAFVPIILMGGVLEVGKILTTVWLHQNWHRAPALIKLYLTTAVIVLMFITSMGVFGFLSRAHVEQTAQAGENLAKLEQIQQEIAQQTAIVDRAEAAIQKAETQGTGSDATLQSQIDREQQRLDTAYERIRVAEQTLEQRTAPFRSELEGIDRVLADLQAAITSGDIRKAQSIVGTRPDGQYGPATAASVESFRGQQQARRQELLAQIESIRSSEPASLSAARAQIQDSTALITRLRGQLGKETGADVQALIDQQNATISQARSRMGELTEQQFVLETEYRKLEAEVGPVKYIAALIYDSVDNNLLEDAVRWVIIIIVAVFDPLAVCLVLAATMTIEWSRPRKTAWASDPRIKELSMKLNQHNEILTELERLLDENLDRIDPAEYTKLQQEHATMLEQQAELVATLEHAKNENDTLVDKVVATEAERDNYSSQVAQLSEGVEGFQRRAEELVTRIAELEGEIKRRDEVVLKMAEKYQLVERDSFPQEVEAEATQPPRNE